MTFKFKNLSVLSYANGFTHWHYRAGDTPLADLLMPGHFHEASDLVAIGDQISISGTNYSALCAVASVGLRGRIIAMSSVSFDGVLKGKADE